MASKRIACRNYGFGSIYTRETKSGLIRWYISYYNTDGKRIRQVVKNAATREQAFDALKKTVFKEYNQKEGRKPRVMFKDFATEFLNSYSMIHKRSWKSDEKYFREIIPCIGSMHLEHITPRSIQAYISRRLKDGVKKNSTNRHLQLLRKMFNYALELGYEVGDNPVKSSMLFNEAEFARTRILAVEEEKRLLAQAAPHIRNIIIFAIQTGCRLQEILKLRIEDVDFSKGEITIRAENNKAGKLDTIPMNKKTRNLARDIILENKGRSDHLFNYYDKHTKKLRPIRSIKKGFVRARNDAGIRDFQFRDTRRTFASRLHAQGVDPLIVQRLLRHSSFKISEQVYIQSSMKMMKDAVEKLGQSAEKEVILAHDRHMNYQVKSETPLTSLFSVN